MRADGEAVTQAIREEITKQGADDRIHTSRTRCNGRCEDACVVIVYPEGVWYKGIDPAAGRQIVQDHLLQGRPVADHAAYTYEAGRFRATGLGPAGKSKAE